MITRRTALALPGLLSARAANAAWPERPIRLVVPFPAGSATDVMARNLQDPLAHALGQPIILDNRGGANGTVGTEHVAQSAPDGQTLLVYSTSAASVNPHTMKQLPYDPLRSFAPIGFIAEMPYILVVGPDSPVRDLPGFIAFLKSRGGEATFACANSASVIAVSLVTQMTGTQVQVVPYRGGPEALTEVMAGRVDATFTDLGPGLSLVRGGKVRALGVTTLQPFPLVPDLPPLSTAMPDYDLTVWYGLVAPTGTPPEIVAAVARALDQALNDPGLVQRFAAQGYVPRHMSTTEFAAFLPQQLVLWGDRVRRAGIQPQ